MKILLFLLGLTSINFGFADHHDAAQNDAEIACSKKLTAEEQEQCKRALDGKDADGEDDVEELKPAS